MSIGKMSDEPTRQANGQTDANVASKTDKPEDARAEVSSAVEPAQPFSWL